jgi:hypothetical protein
MNQSITPESRESMRPASRQPASFCAAFQGGRPLPHPSLKRGSWALSNFFGFHFHNDLTKAAMIHSYVGAMDFIKGYFGRNKRS